MMLSALLPPTPARYYDADYYVVTLLRRHIKMIRYLQDDDDWHWRVRRCHFRQRQRCATPYENADADITLSPFRCRLG